MIRCLIVLCLALSAAGTHAGDPPSVDQVLDRFVEAVGGREALTALESVHYRGTIVQDLTWQTPRRQETPFVAAADADGGLRYAESARWADLADRPGPAPDRRLRWLLHPRFALVIREHFPDLEVAEVRRRDGREEVVLLPAGGRPETDGLCFDAASGLLTRIGFHHDLTDWRPVAGVLRPGAYVCGRKGGHTTWRFEAMDAGPAPGD